MYSLSADTFVELNLCLTADMSLRSALQVTPTLRPLGVLSTVLRQVALYLGKVGLVPLVTLSEG